MTTVLARCFPPSGTTDCHVHVVYPDYPMVSPRSFTPLPARADALRAMMARCGVDRVVLVQMSVFGTDNSAMLEAMAELGEAARGVVQLSGRETPAELDRLHGAGVRGVRLNFHTTSANAIDAARRRLLEAGRVSAERGWHVQVFAAGTLVAALEAELAAVPSPVVLDHFGLLPVRRRGDVAEQAVLRLRRGGNVWVKLSAPYRLDAPDDDAAVTALARDLDAAGPDRVVWASDWPHTPAHTGIATESPTIAAYRSVDTRGMLDAFARWFPRTEDQRRILVENPARLYGYG